MKTRLATLADSTSIQRVHIATWLAAYRGLVPDSHLEPLTHDKRFNFWLDALGAPGSDTFIHVAEDAAGQVVGFAAAGPSRTRHLLFEGELYAVYVLPDQQGGGIGGALVRATASEFLRRGVRSMILYVLKENPARRFYEGLGGQLLEERQVDIGGTTVADVVYGWSDIKALAAGFVR